MLFAAVARVALGQGGPPMITDDPGTPGNGKWENNFAISAIDSKGRLAAYQANALHEN
jgi:hypothetical protein